MFRRLMAWFGLRSGDDAGDDETDDSRFVPSELDASVRYAHGGSKTGIEGEVVEIREEAEKLEEQHEH